MRPSISVSGLYSNGPFTAGIAYEQHNKLRTGLPATVACPNCQTSLKDQGITAAVSYQWGAVKLAGVYEQLQYDIATGGDLKRNMWGVSMTANWGPGQFYAGTGGGNERSRLGAVRDRGGRHDLPACRRRYAG